MLVSVTVVELNMAKHFSMHTTRKYRMHSHFSTPFAAWFVGFCVDYAVHFCVSEITPDIEATKKTRRKVKYSTHSKFTPKLNRLLSTSVHFLTRSF